MTSRASAADRIEDREGEFACRSFVALKSSTPDSRDLTLCKTLVPTDSGDGFCFGCAALTG